MNAGCTASVDAADGVRRRDYCMSAIGVAMRSLSRGTYCAEGSLSETPKTPRLPIQRVPQPKV